jgi:transcriptional regulator with XRE-family HTH domain
MKSNFTDWFNNKYLEWENKQGRRQTITSFAKYLGIRQPYVSNWLNGKYKPSGTNIVKIANKLGPEIYDFFSEEQKDFSLICIDQLPLDIRSHLFFAVTEINESITSSQLDPESSKTAKLVEEIFFKHGFKLTINSTPASERTLSVK